MPMTLETWPLPQIHAIRRLLTESRAIHAQPLTQLLPRFITVYLRHQFSPNEIRGLDLLAPDLTPADIERFISKSRFLSLLHKVNPQHKANLVEDKEQFHYLCKRFHFPAPKHYARLKMRRLTPLEDARLPDNLRNLLSSVLPDEFVIKASEGVYGRDLYVCKRVTRHYLNVNGELISTEAFCQILETRSLSKTYLIQNRLSDHPRLESLSAADGLQCARFTTFVDEQGTPKLLFYMQKLICKPNLTDNFSFGRTGNLIALGDACGVLTEAVVGAKSGFGLARTSRHPQSREVITGFQLPWWEEAKELCLKAAPKLLPLRTVGWDVALTRDGPVVVEANAWWDPVNYAPELLNQAHLRQLAEATREPERRFVRNRSPRASR